ncbi:MAG: antitoxin [Bryobacteraceae bacterium]
MTLEDDAIEAVQEFSVRRGISLGKAASELIRRGSRYQLGVRKVNGLPVLDASGDIPAITAERVRELLDEE